MHSKIADAIRLHRGPVAILLTDHKPNNALEFTEQGGQKNRCIIPLFVAAMNGRKPLNLCGSSLRTSLRLPCRRGIW
jgi:hypothetical protein